MDILIWIAIGIALLGLSVAFLTALLFVTDVKTRTVFRPRNERYKDYIEDACYMILNVILFGCAITSIMGFVVSLIHVLQLAFA